MPTPVLDIKEVQKQNIVHLIARCEYMPHCFKEINLKVNLGTREETFEVTKVNAKHGTNEPHEDPYEYFDKIEDAVAAYNAIQPLPKEDQHAANMHVPLNHKPEVGVGGVAHVGGTLVSVG